MGDTSNTSNVNVLVDIYRTIVPRGGFTGFAEINGQTIQITERPWMHREQQVYQLNVGDEVPVPDLAGKVEVTGIGAIDATTTVSVSITSITPPPSPLMMLQDTPDIDDPDDDEDDPEDDPCGNSSAGDALHLRLTTGNIWTRVPILKTLADDEYELDFELRYETLRAHEDGPLGWGWSALTMKWDAYGNLIERTDAELHLEKFEFNHSRFMIWSHGISSLIRMSGIMNMRRSTVIS